MASSNVYSAVAQGVAWATAGPIMQITVPASATAGLAKSIEVIRVSVSQQTSTTSAALGVALKRATGTWTATAPASITPAVYNGAEAVAGSMAKCTVAAFGTSPADGAGATSLVVDSWNVLSGWLYLPVPEERITISSGHFFLIDLAGTVPSATYNVTAVYREMA